MPTIYAPSIEHIMQAANDDAELGEVIAKINRFIWTYRIYIGITTQNPKDRLSQHQNGKRGWAQYLTVLWMSSNPNQIEKVERFLIANFRDKYLPFVKRTNVDNIAPGGEGVRHDRERFFVYILTDDDPRFLLGQF